MSPSTRPADDGEETILRGPVSPLAHYHRASELLLCAENPALRLEFLDHMSPLQLVQAASVHALLASIGTSTQQPAVATTLGLLTKREQR